MLVADFPTKTGMYYFQDVGRPKHSGRGAKVLSTKVTGRPDPRRSSSLPNSAQTLVPPMTSVVVERHQPITKVTCFCLVIFLASYSRPIKTIYLKNVHHSL